MKRHITGLDGLRGIAVAGVLSFHAGHLPGGYLGVDLFFVLSGYLITSLLLAEHTKTESVDLKDFWARRARRLLPALFAMLIGVALYATTLAARSEIASIRSQAVATVLYVANWHQIFGQNGYFDFFATPSPLQHTWSLAIEEQFYVFWPLVVLLLMSKLKQSPKAFITFCLGAAAASFALMLVLYKDGQDPSRVYLGTDTRMSSILLGAALAAYLAYRGHPTSARSRLLVEGASLVAVAFLAFTWWKMDGNLTITYHGGLLACSFAVAVIILAVTHPEGSLVGRGLSVWPLVFLGTISYGLYLWHFPIYVAMTPACIGLDGWELSVARISVSLILAIALFYLLEMPIRNGTLKETFSARSLALLAPIAAVVVIVVFLVIGYTAPSSTFAATNTPVSPNAPHLMLVGDSGAEQLGERFTEIAGDVQLNVDNQGIKGCRLMIGDGLVRSLVADDKLGVVTKKCGGDLAKAAAANHPDIVLVHMAGAAITDLKVNGEWLTPCDAAYAQGYESDLRKAVADAGMGGKAKVVLATNLYSGFSNLPDVQAKVNHSTDCLNEIVRRVQQSTPNSYLLDLNGFICPEGKCRETDHGVVLREDHLHFKGDGGRLVARWVADQLKIDLKTPSQVKGAGATANPPQSTTTTARS